jgi:CheY-like chemotaxis protein
VINFERHPITVFCADDDPGFRGVLRTLIEATPGFALVGEAACGWDTVAAVAAVRPDLLLMDVRMPRMGGIEAARTLMGRDPELVIVLMSAAEMPPPSGLDTSGPRVIFVRKEHLCRSVLLDLWNRERASTFAIALRTWVRTVWWAICSSSAISGPVLPRAISRTISR